MALVLFIVVHTLTSSVSAAKMFCTYISKNTFRCVFIYSDLTVSILDCTTNADKTKTCKYVEKTAIPDLPTSIQDALGQIAQKEGQTIEDAKSHDLGIENPPLAPK